MFKGALFRRTAICRGAIFKGFLDGSSIVAGGGPAAKLALPPNLASPVSVVSTIARVSLGVEYCNPFQEGVHRECDRYWDKNEKVYMARGQMMWYLRKVRESNNDTNRHELVFAKSHVRVTTFPSWNPREMDFTGLTPTTKSSTLSNKTPSANVKMMALQRVKPQV
jgi:hypothetical protein